jgi:proton-translocating NADH-quinone oxidoreductase chain N
MVISPVHYIVAPLLAAFAIPLLTKLYKDSARVIPGIVLFYNVIVSFVLFKQVLKQGMINETIAGWQAPWGINLVLTPFTAFLASMVSVLGFIIWLYGFRFKRTLKGGEVKYYEILQMMMVAGAIGVIITGDLFNMFVFIEIVGITAYSLTAFYRERNGAEAGFKYLLIGSLASTFLLLAILIIYTQTGTLNMAQIAERMVFMPQTMKITALIFFLIALGIEAEMFPLNAWAPDAYEQAPTPTSAAFAAVVSIAGVYALVRVLFTLFDVAGVHRYLIIMGFVTMLIAEMAAIAQKNLKRMLAYSSIGQVGLVLIAFGIGSKLAVFGAIFLMLNHAVIKTLLFMSGSYFIYNTGDKQLTGLNGMHKQLPYVSALFSLAAFAIIGFPPFSGFWSKLYILLAASDQNMIYLIIGILLVTIIELVYYLRAVGLIYFAKEEAQVMAHKPSINALVAMTTLAIFIILIGIYPDLITGYLSDAANALLDKTHYIEQILGQK